MQTGKCRFCNHELKHTFCDLGLSPFSNFYLEEKELKQHEPFYPLHVYVCDSCFLVQLGDSHSPNKLFSDDYAYFSSYSESWLKHAKKYVSDISHRFHLNSSHLVIELASNDGYLLQYFKEIHIPVLGIEPAANVAAAAQALGIPTWVKFFGVQTAQELIKEGKQADLLLGNNVLAHVPDPNDFVHGMKIALKPQGLITMEFPHLLRLMEENQFDTIYHEHFSYLSFLTVETIFSKYGLTLFDVEELPTHGGSLRIYAKHSQDSTKPISPRVEELKKKEIAYGLNKLDKYQAFQTKVIKIKENLLKFLNEAKQQGKKVAAYGAPAKGNTLLNYCGVSTHLIDYTVDRSPRKQGRYLPGTHIPIREPEFISKTKPDYLLILPWNLKDEVMQQMQGIQEWGGKFVIPIPQLEIIQ